MAFQRLGSPNSIIGVMTNGFGAFLELVFIEPQYFAPFIVLYELEILLELG